MNHYNTIFYAESTWEDFDVRVSNQHSGGEHPEVGTLGSDPQAEQENNEMVSGDVGESEI